MFEQPSTHDLWPEVVESIRHFEHIKFNASFWVAGQLCSCWHSNPERELIRIGRILNCDELAALELPIFARIGTEAWACLTEKGRALGVDAMAPTVRRAKGRWYLAREYARCRRDLAAGAFFGAIEILTDAPRDCCHFSQAQAGKRFTVAQSLPTLPLSECDFDFCGCDYRALSHSELEREKLPTEKSPLP